MSDTFNLSGDFRGATVNIKSVIQANAHWDVNRKYMLERLRSEWLEGVLTPTVKSQSLITLGLHHRPDLVVSPLDGVVQRKKEANAQPATSHTILNVFNSSQGALLILGEPGAGKTITLLQLANALVERAEADGNQPIPIVLNLSSWSDKYPSFENWLVWELQDKYFVPRPVAVGWIGKNALTLLLDGLDEVAAEERTDCINAINRFRHDHGPSKLVVCSRRLEYEDLQHRIQLDDAVLLQPLDQDQIGQLLAKHDRDGIVTKMLGQDATLKQFAQSPLMLNIMLQASQEMPAEDWGHLGDAPSHRERLFDVYLNSVFSRRAPTQAHSREYILQVLPWLARNMSERGKNVFLMEELDSGWLKTRGQQLAWKFGMHLFIAGLLALTIGLVYKFSGAPSQYAPRMALAVGSAAFVTGILASRLNNPVTLLLSMLLTALTTGWALEDIWGGLIVGLLFGIPGGATAIATKTPRMTERLEWSWWRALLVLFSMIAIELIAGTIIYQIAGVETLSNVAGILQFAALPIGMGITFLFGWRPSLRVAKTVRPNQGFWQSLRNMTGFIVFLLIVLMPLSIPNGMSLNLTNQKGLWDLDFLLSSLFFVLSTVWLIALPIGLAVGGAACLQQIILRSVLTSADKMPWNLIQVLDNATDRILLQRVGGGYIFQHRLLQDYFANLQPKSK